MFFFPKNSLQYLGNKLQVFLFHFIFPMTFESWKQKSSVLVGVSSNRDMRREREKKKERPPPMKASHIFCVDLIEGHDPSWRPLFTLMHGLHHLLFFGNIDLEWKPFKDSIR